MDSELVMQILVKMLGMVLGLFFVALSALHRYWALGRKKGRDIVIP